MTLHLSDIKQALERGIVSDIEDAFRALIGWPNEADIDGATEEDRASILPRICEALHDDPRAMPDETTALIEEQFELRGHTYADGAEAVLLALPYWQEVARKGAA